MACRGSALPMPSTLRVLLLACFLKSQVRVPLPMHRTHALLLLLLSICFFLSFSGSLRRRRFYLITLYISSPLAIWHFYFFPPSKDEFAQEYPTSKWTGSDTPFPALKGLLVKYQNPQEADALSRIHKELDEVYICIYCTPHLPPPHRHTRRRWKGRSSQELPSITL